MGCSSSCRPFELFSTAIQWIARHKLGIRSVKILDDFLLASVSEKTGTFQLRAFLSMCEDIGVPMTPDKTFGTATTMTFVGMRSTP